MTRSSRNSASSSSNRLPLNIDLTDDGMFSDGRDRPKLSPRITLSTLADDTLKVRHRVPRDPRIPWVSHDTLVTRADEYSLVPLGSARVIRDTAGFKRVEDGLECYRCGANMERLPFHMVYLLCRDCEESMELTHDFYITDYQ